MPQPLQIPYYEIILKRFTFFEALLPRFLRS
jgi:hypothetical protein